MQATVVEIIKPGRTVERVRVLSEGKHFFVQARLFVLALGAIENARLLLHSDRYDPQGIGNENGFVGRCFADQLGTKAGLILTSAHTPYRNTIRAIGGIASMPHLSFPDRLLRAEKLVNFGIVLDLSPEEESTYRKLLSEPSLFPVPWDPQQKELFHFVVRFETTPNPDSRVTLSNERDRFKVRRVRLDWRLNDIEFETVERVVDILAGKVGAASLGRIKRLFVDTPEERRRTLYQSHQLGTTRMSADPSSGVVDSNCRVFSTENLYVAGSSVFPTYGFANPTLTLVALATRLGEHLQSRLRKEER